MDTGKITCKLFAGFLLTAEIKMQLSRSKTWQGNACVQSDGSEEHLLEVHYQGKDYLGQYFQPKVNLKELKAREVSMRQLLQDYCPLHDCNLINLCVFPQIFVS